jgi:hypothetical protein
MSAYAPECAAERSQTLDPASLLITSHYHNGLAEFSPEALRHEYYGDDVNQISDVARSESGISTLHEATGGHPSSSPSWHMKHDDGRGPGNDRMPHR